MATYTLIVTTAANTAPINSTKVKVVANNQCFFAINGIANVTSNAGSIIPANTPTSVNMQGLGNNLSLASVTGGSTIVTVQEIGTVYPSAMSQNSTTFLNT